MVFKEGKQYILFVLAGTAIFAHVAVDDTALPMSFEEKEELKEEAKDMFYHAYRAYMENAYPADELMPLSCKGRWKDPLNSRGDLDDTLGNFSLTLVDSLDTLVILGDLEEFETAVKLVIKDVSFDQDVIVSVFETNIRVLGGLLSAHILAEYFQQRDGIMPWYRAELLTMAKDLGFRLLPAFNTTTGIPHSRVNLRHGLKNMRLSAHQETCTACAGTMILEMAALSRLTGEPVFEQKAHRAMDGLWRIRHRSSDLMGTVLNVQSGDWVRRDSGVGAGIDSYYEYCLKAYILLGDEKYLGRFNKHYSAIMKYISQGPMLVDVHMHRPHTNSKNFMDALLAFWPGLQVLKGDIKPAVETHEMLYQIMQRHNLIPEAFTTDFHVHWGQHPLRPEFVESTYFLYKATNDPYYLEVGKSALKSLQKFARVPCGYATVKDVRTGGHDDRMDSFVLAETFKYLYLLFADPNDLLIDLDEFLFTTEAHLLPLSLSRKHNLTSFDINESHTEDLEGLNSEYARVCPNTLDLFPETVRKPLKNLVNGMCPRTMKRKLLASQFIAGNSEHLQLLKNMGIAVLSMADGRVQLVHTFASARSQADAKEGLLFMQEMLELSQSQKYITDQTPMSVIFERNGQTFSVAAGPAQFGKDLTQGTKVTAKVGIANPIHACDTLLNSDRLKGRIVIIERGDCMFVNKVRKVEEAGAVAAIVIDNKPGTSSMTSSMFAMSGDGKNDVSIPAVFLFHDDASELLKAIEENLGIEITITDPNNTVPMPFAPVSSLTLVQKLSQEGHSIEILDVALESVQLCLKEKLSYKENTMNRRGTRMRKRGQKQISSKTKLLSNEDARCKWVNDDYERDTSKQTVDVASTVSGVKGEQLVDDSKLKSDFHASIERLLGGKEIIKVAHRDPRLDKPNPNQYVDFELQKLLNDHQIRGDGEIPAWLLKVYENLQLQEGNPKVQTSWLLQHLTDDLISHPQKREVQPPPTYKSNDINESNSGKLTANEVVQLIDSSLNLKKFDIYSEILRPLKVQILEKELDETLVNLKLLLTDRPKGWRDTYEVHVSAVKTIIKKLELFLKEVESAVTKKPPDDIKAKTITVFILDAKENLKNLKQSLNQWDILAKIIMETEKPIPKNDDIILVERKKSSKFINPNGNDEL